MNKLFDKIQEFNDYEKTQTALLETQAEEANSAVDKAYLLGQQLSFKITDEFMKDITQSAQEFKKREETLKKYIFNEFTSAFWDRESNNTIDQVDAVARFLMLNRMIALLKTKITFTIKVKNIVYCLEEGKDYEDDEDLEFLREKLPTKMEIKFTIENGGFYDEDVLESIEEETGYLVEDWDYDSIELEG